MGKSNKEWLEWQRKIILDEYVKGEKDANKASNLSHRA